MDQRSRDAMQKQIGRLPFRLLSTCTHSSTEACEICSLRVLKVLCWTSGWENDKRCKAAGAVPYVKQEWPKTLRTCKPIQNCSCQSTQEVESSQPLSASVAAAYRRAEFCGTTAFTAEVPDRWTHGGHTVSLQHMYSEMQNVPRSFASSSRAPTLQLEPSSRVQQSC